MTWITENVLKPCSEDILSRNLTEYCELNIFEAKRVKQNCLDVSKLLMSLSKADIQINNLVIFESRVNFITQTLPHLGFR